MEYMIQKSSQAFRRSIIASKLKNPISSFTDEELMVFYKAFNIDHRKDKAIYEADKKISKITLSVGGFLQEGLFYSQLIDYLAKVQSITLEKESNSEREKELFLKLFQKGYELKSESEKQKFRASLQEQGLSTSEITSITALSSIAVAQFSGFGVYMLASSTASAIAGLFGATLSFGFYTSMSTVISYAIGPLGFVLAAIPMYQTFKDVRSLDEAWEKTKTIGSGIKKIFTGDNENALRIFEYIAAIRLMKEGEALSKINSFNKDIERLQKEKDYSDSLISQKSLLVNEKEKELVTIKRKLKNLELQKDQLDNDLKRQLAKEKIITSDIQLMMDKKNSSELFINHLKNSIT